MKEPSPTTWVGGIEPGMLLLVVKHTRLWPIEMWYNSTDDDTLVMVTPIITPGDICGVLDVLRDPDVDVSTYAALVVCSEGIGCVLADADYFQLLQCEHA